MSTTFYLGRTSQTASDFLRASDPRMTVQVQLDRAAREKMLKSRNFIEHLCEKNIPVYGVNTGVGLLSKKHIDRKDLVALQKNIIRSHCAGVGPILSIQETRLLMLLRGHTLALGYSGARPEVAETIISFVNKGVTPVIPSEGSVGASGDLAPLAHLALCLMGEGFVTFEGKKLQTNVVLKQLNIAPLEFQEKEGLALINGTQLMMVYCLTLLARIRRMVHVADIIAACSTEAIRGTIRAFDDRIHRLRPHGYQVAVADNMRRLMSESQIGASHKDCDKIQDPYSFRCIPQVHGACRDLVASFIPTVETELHSVTDNPIVVAEDQEVLNGGNFHGAPLAMGLDVLALAVAEYGSISERRIEKLTNPSFSDLPAFLVKNPGLNSGLMLAQVTAAALASENKLFCHPASVDTIPTSADKEDHVSMGPIAGRKLKKIIQNTERILAIEALCARQGLWLLEPLRPGKGVAAAYRKLSETIAPIENDRVLSDDIENTRKLLFNTRFVKDVARAVGDIQ